MVTKGTTGAAALARAIGPVAIESPTTMATRIRISLAGFDITGDFLLKNRGKMPFERAGSAMVVTEILGMFLRSAADSTGTIEPMGPERTRFVEESGVARYRDGDEHDGHSSCRDSDPDVVGLHVPAPRWLALAFLRTGSWSSFRLTPFVPQCDPFWCVAASVENTVDAAVREEPFARVFRNCNCRKRWSRFRQFPVRQRPPCIGLIMRSTAPRRSKTVCLTAPTTWSASNGTNRWPAVSCTGSRNARSAGFAANGDGSPNPDRSNERSIDEGGRYLEMTTATVSTRSPRCMMRATKLKNAA